MDENIATATTNSILSAEGTAALATGVYQMHFEFLTKKVLSPYHSQLKETILPLKQLQLQEQMGLR